MADDNQKASGQAARASRGRRRPPPTIDLTATEVAAREPPAEAESETASQPSASPVSEPAAESPPSPPPPRGVPLWAMFGATAGGVVITVTVLLLLLGSPAGNGDAGKQAARIGTLEATVRDLAARAPPVTADPKTVASMSDRVAKLEAASSMPRAPASDPALAGRLTALEQRIGALTDGLTALKRSSDAATAAAEAAQRRADAAAAKAETVQTAGAQGAAVDRQDMTALGNRLTALEQAAQALKSDLVQQLSTLAKQRETRTDEHAVRLAVVAEMLKAAVARGERFRAELDAAKSLAPDQAALKLLEAFADGGVPTAAALAQRLRAVLPAMRRATEPKAAADGGFLKRLQVNAERLVRIQPIGEQPGPDAGSVLARAEFKAGRGDIAGVLAELAALPPEMRAPAEEWIKAAQARDAAIDASRRFAAAQVGALAGPLE